MLVRERDRQHLHTTMLYAVARPPIPITSNLPNNVRWLERLATDMPYLFAGFITANFIGGATNVLGGTATESNRWASLLNCGCGRMLSRSPIKLLTN
jgi:hypothetical protein